MKKRNKTVKVLACSMSAVLGAGTLFGCLGILSACGGKTTDELSIMTEELNELYNPYYSTAGTDMDVVGQTQLSMFTTNSSGEIACGENEATVVLDWKKERNDAVKGEENDWTTDYYFVIKNGIMFSDGVHPLTMNDVIFNMYVYLDFAYTGSSTMYSTKIMGLQEYRTQTTTEGADSRIANQANTYALNRINELKFLFQDVGESGTQGSYYATQQQMVDAINNHSCSVGYMQAIGEQDNEKAKAQLLKDYYRVIGDPNAAAGSDERAGLFRKELENDYKSSKEAYVEEPYKSAPIYASDGSTLVRTGFDEAVSFMYTEGFVELEHPQTAGSTADKTKIEKAILGYDHTKYTTQEQLINFAWTSKVYSNLDQILDYWATGTTMRTEFAAKARDIILHENLQDGELVYKNISGIKSLGHMADGPESVTINGTSYKVAKEHEADGTPKNAGEYDILRITVDGTDPKAEWNFGFTVAPHYYYSDPAKYPVDIANDQFGVEWGSFDFHMNVLQGNNTNGVSKNKVPVGAGPYMATDRTYTKDSPLATEFFYNNQVFYKSNPHFLMGEPKIKKMKYVVLSANNALSSLEYGDVHYVSPQLTTDNYNAMEKLKSKGFSYVDVWQLGYGYIGVNAKYVKQLELRKAIMSAMQASLITNYYKGGTAITISWPMSAVSWAYPRTSGTLEIDPSNPTTGMDNSNGKSWTQFTTKQAAVQKVKDFMSQATYTQSDLKITFTIAGASMDEHPAYATMKQAMDILNECGWDVTLKPDPSALTKLATGSLAVWAAAWGSTIDPDMYQVYHKNSTATSTLAWGYDAIKNESDKEYEEERRILNDLSDKVDEGREIDDRAARAGIYKDAMKLVLDLAVEFPLYQRKTVYAYNLKVIKESSLPHDENGNLICNPYASPLSRIWEVELVG